MISWLRDENRFTILFLILLPLAGGFGTNTGILEKSINQLPSWFAIAAIILFVLYKKMDEIGILYRDLLISGLIILIAALASFQIGYGYVLHPYHQNSHLFEQNSEI